MPRKPVAPSRRSFLAASAAATAAGGVLLDTTPVHAKGNDLIKIGLVGCGGRGGGAALNALRADPNTRLVAMCDAFGDRLDGKHNDLKEEFGDRVDVPKERRYTGFDGYKQLIDSDVDVVLLVTPPGFRPIHYKYAIEKGKHVFMEKPHAVDATGIRSVLETTKMAVEKKRCVVSGFCYRYDPPKRETLKRIQDGQIGKVQSVHTTYLTGDLWFRGDDPTWTPMDYQMRNWYYFSWISGDFLVEQHIHSIDKARWVMGDEFPIAAQGMGGRQTRTAAKFGNIYDHFTVVYEFASGAKVYSQCRQVGGCYNEVADHVVGTKGTAELMKHTVTTDAGTTKSTARAKKGDMYQVEHDEFFAHIRAGTVINDAERSAYSSLMGIMGREAAYSGQRITWEQMLKSTQSLAPAKYAFGDHKPMAVPVPGRYKFA